MPDPLDRADVREVLGANRFAHFAVSTRRGPHVSLGAFVASGGRLWFATSRNSLKVKAIRRRPSVSVLVGDAARAVVLVGHVDVISGWGRQDIANLLDSAVDVGVAAATFTVRHLEMLAKSTRDFIEDGTVPVDRVLVRVDPRRGLVLTGDVVTGRWGRWPAPAALPRAQKSPETPVLLDGIPKRAARALEDHRSCAVGWECASGPIVTPGRLAPGEAVVDVSADVLRRAGLGERRRVCVTLDRGSGHAGNFAGIMLRGTATVAGRAGSTLRIRVDSDRTTWWSGFKTGTVHRP